ncbi:cobalamin biosynthesis protein CobQ [Salipiger sp. IMCC34102]|uniref:cobalamin biosynthesis protein CobQ n=1 Tax=Salipiger sp. IMCC34102 TaxID=2510647 RepID=UPI00101C4EC5|nr:cobalamin biosynthesis protein CobQ [Salipiger sp. IMCC34102]RYH02235.1 cobalamin biosynthesis protein CobQ [Salipiger sp. IMCC34102]
MNTPAHLIFGLAAFGRPKAGRITLAALAGGLVPDLSLYLLAGWQLAVMGTDPQVVFGTMYYSALWQGIFRVDNSVPLWAVLAAVGLLWRSPVVVAFAGSGLLHLALDFPLHHDDARAHFWPLTDWVFASPLSYWDPAHFGGVIGPIEVGACVILSLWLWRRFRSRAMRGLIAALAVLEVTPALIFGLMMA